MIGAAFTRANQNLNMVKHSNAKAPDVTLTSLHRVKQWYNLSSLYPMGTYVVIKPCAIRQRVEIRTCQFNLPDSHYNSGGVLILLLGTISLQLLKDVVDQ